MLTIILGILVALGLMVLMIVLFDNEFITVMLTTLIVVICFAVGIFVPVSGFHEPQVVESIELTSLSNTVASEGGGLLYVSVDANNVYSYRYETETDLAKKEGKVYKVDTISERNNVEIFEVETTDGSKPILEKHVTKGKKSIWTFAAGATKTTYIFYVPEGSIAKNVALT